MAVLEDSLVVFIFNLNKILVQMNLTGVELDPDHPVLIESNDVQDLDFFQNQSMQGV